MKRLLKSVGVGLISLVLLGGISAAALLGVAIHTVRVRMAAPKLDPGKRVMGDLVFRTLDGQPEDLAAMKGKVVFLNLWGTWCIGCIAEMPTVQKLYDHYRGDPQVQFLIVSRLDPPGRVAWYARQYRLTLPFYVTRDEDIPESMQYHQYPATFIFGKDGRLVSEHLGAADWSKPSVISLLDRLRTEK